MTSPLSLDLITNPLDTSLDEVEIRILEAAIEQFALVGIRLASTDDIARRARINRATLYRRMGAKDQIVRAALVHEVRKVLASIAAEFEDIDDITERIAHGFAVTVTVLRTHPLATQLLAVDREETLVWVTAGAGDILRLATTFIADQVQRAWSDSGLPDNSPAEVIASLVVRLVQSLVLTPDAPPELHTQEELREFATTYLQPLILGFALLDK